MQPDDLLDDAAETYRAKNDDYGDSWRTVGAIIWAMAGEESITLESPMDVIRFGLYTRRIDKLCGAFQGDFVVDEELNFEDAKNRHCDEGTYAFMQGSTYDDAGELADDGFDDPSLQEQIIADAACGMPVDDIAEEYGLPPAAVVETIDAGGEDEITEYSDASGNRERADITGGAEPEDDSSDDDGNGRTVWGG